MAKQRILASLLLLSFTVIFPAQGETVLFDPAKMRERAKRVDFVGKNEFSVELSDQGELLRSVPQKSASGLYQPVDRESVGLTRVRWRWRVDQLQSKADLRVLATEDFGAMIMFVFGEPSLFNRDVPTLGYVWTATPVANGSIIRSTRYKTLAYIQVRGRAEVGQMRLEERDLAADYQRVFGKSPGELKFIAVFNDNDQTEQPTSALFGPIIDATR